MCQLQKVKYLWERATKTYGQICPIARTLDLLGERWTLLVLRQLMMGDTRFSALLERLPGVPSRTLSDRLKMMEANGLVQRVIYSEHPLRAEYHLTDEGESLRPVLGALAEWGMDHLLNARERRIVLRHVNLEDFALA